MEERYIGCEDELALLTRYSNNEDWSNQGLNAITSIVLREYMTSERTPRNTVPTAHFYENGMRIYIDVGDHPEIATAESTDIDDVAAGNLAGLLMLHAGFKRAYADGRIPQYTLFNRVVSSNKSWGFHENYQVARSIARGDGSGELDARQLHALQAFLAIRPLMSGAGSMYDGRFQFAQKATRIYHGVHSSTTTAKALINTRDEPHADPARYARLHIPCADPTSPHVLRRTLGMTSLVIRMIEQQRLIRDDFRGTHWGDVTRQTSADLTMTKKFAWRNRQVTALDLHEFFLEEGHKMADRGIPLKEKESLDESEMLYDALRALQRDGRRYEHDPVVAERARLLGFSALAKTDLVDWAQRFVYLESVKHAGDYMGTRKRASDGEEAMEDRDPNFDIFSQNGKAGIFWARTTTPAARRVASAEHIKARMKSPPTGRAQVRRDFIQRFGDDPAATVDWAILSYYKPFDERSLLFRLPEPGDAHPAGYEDFAAQVALRRGEALSEENVA